MGVDNCTEHPQVTPAHPQNILQNIQEQLSGGVRKIIDEESLESFIAHAHLLHVVRRNGNNSLLQEQHPLYDKVFYRADTIERGSDGKYKIYVHDTFVRLNEKVLAPGIPTVAELRTGLTEGILFSGVGALSIHTRNGTMIPLLRRDSEAPTDPGKYTLPAGRADKSPGLAAYEECLEEIVIMARKSGTLSIIVPYLKESGISEKKARLLVEIARAKYLHKILQSANNISTSVFEEIINAPLISVHAQLGGGECVETIFTTEINGEVSSQIIIKEDGLNAYHDKGVNTFEFIRALSVDLSEYDELQLGDGDGFGREAELFTPEEVDTLTADGLTVKSLEGAQKLGVFQKL